MGLEQVRNRKIRQKSTGPVTSLPQDRFLRYLTAHTPCNQRLERKGTRMFLAPRLLAVLSCSFSTLPCLLFILSFDLSFSFPFGTHSRLPMSTVLSRAPLGTRYLLSPMPSTDHSPLTAQRSLVALVRLRPRAAHSPALAARKDSAPSRLAARPALAARRDSAPRRPASPLSPALAPRRPAGLALLARLARRRPAHSARRRQVLSVNRHPVHLVPRHPVHSVNRHPVHSVHRHPADLALLVPLAHKHLARLVVKHPARLARPARRALIPALVSGLPASRPALAASPARHQRFLFRRTRRAALAAPVVLARRAGLARRRRADSAARRTRNAR